MKSIYCWGVFRNGKLRWCDDLPMIYKAKDAAESQISIFDKEKEVARKVILIIKELHNEKNRSRSKETKTRTKKGTS